MHFSHFAVALATLAGTAWADFPSSWGPPIGGGSGGSSGGLGANTNGTCNDLNFPGLNCVAPADVDRFVSGYTYLLEFPGGPDFNSTAEDILAANNFTVQSDSIRTLSGLPLGEPAYPSRDVYIATQFVTPALPTVTTIDTFASCNKIAWRWTATGIGSNALPVNGIITFDIDTDNNQIQTVYSEFNTAAFETDLGE
ncbi:hypothetical protein BD289DRAFT_128045 [Coniella lustricola]|uniref:NTF2-like domain-containing protein n=1 Tax=Coniella lustricola TaxID=2025994 RepID=A0A2T2ZWA0_9PEZI|nr:hypothetical protein BD289DRAFT_128045 [Coniella lustricola]